MADVSQIVLKDANGNVIGTYDVKDASVPHDSKAAASGGTTLSLVTTGEKATWNAKSDTDTTYTFANGTNGFTVTPSGGSAQTVTVTPSIPYNVTGSGTDGYIAKFSSNTTLTNGPAFGSSSTKYLRNDGNWVTPTNTTYTFANGTNGFTVTPLGGTAQTVKVTPSIANNLTGKRTQSNRNFNAKTTMSYTGLSLTCPSGHMYIVQAWFRYSQSAPRRVGASHRTDVFAFYDNLAASLDTYDCGHASITFMMYPGETIYYWAMYYDAKQNFITENILDITL